VQNSLLVIFLCVIALLPCFTRAAADDSPDPDTTMTEERKWTITIPVWVPGYRGQFAIGEIDVDGESSGGSGFFDRFFDNKLKINFFFMGAFTYDSGRWRVHADVFGGHFTDDVIFKLTDGTVVSADIQPIVPNLHVAYRVLHRPLGDAGPRWVRNGPGQSTVRHPTAYRSF
jgi:hypothetical protein